MTITEIQDDETKLLVSISNTLKEEYTESESKEWAGSPFEWILSRRSSRQRGKIGEQLVEGWCKSRGFQVSRSPDSDADRVIEGKRIEIKLSSLWTNGQYLFQQIRDQKYDYLLCLGISPFSVHAWIMKKSEIPFDQLKHQHGGAAGRDTWWFSVKPDSVPSWLNVFGGELKDVLEILKEIKMK